MDELDLAALQSEAFQTDALNQFKRHRQPDNNPGTACIDCEEEIPLRRRQAIPGCLRCVDCQQQHETEAACC
jgi:phage/conjugal plasmid C-4 type zinc finger TraR family protein